MKRFRLTVAVSLAVGLLISACSQAPEARKGLEPQFGTALDDFAIATASDPRQGLVYVTGIESVNSNSLDDYNRFLRQYNKNGKLIWNKRFSNIGGSGASVDSAGNIYVPGFKASSGGGKAIFAKLNTSGRVLFQRELGRGVNSIAGFEGDARGNSYLLGVSRQNGTISDSSLYKYDKQGKLIWKQTSPSGDSSEYNYFVPNDLGVAGDGSVYVLGSYYDDDIYLLTKYSGVGHKVWTIQACPASPGGGSPALVTAGAKDVYLACSIAGNVFIEKYDRNGLPVWGDYRYADGTEVSAIDVDSNENLYVAGSVFSQDNGSDPDLFISKYTTNGKLSWNYAPRRKSAAENVFGVSANDRRRIYIAGYTTGKVNGKNSGGADAFLMRIGDKGQEVWER